MPTGHRAERPKRVIIKRVIIELSDPELFERLKARKETAEREVGFAMTWTQFLQHLLQRESRA